MKKIEGNLLSISEQGTLTLFARMYYDKGEMWVVPLPFGGSVEINPAKNALKPVCEWIERDPMPQQIDYIKIDAMRFGAAFLEGVIPVKAIEECVEKDNFVEIQLEIASATYTVRVYPHVQEGLQHIL